MRIPPQFAPLMVLLLLALASGDRGYAQSVFINELHYDNDGADVQEGIEIAGPAGTNLANYDLVFYNGASSGAAVVYLTFSLSGTLPDFGAGFGVKWFPISGIQNGGNDGVALYQKINPQVIQFLSYEGATTASAGVAAGMTSTDIGVTETGTAPTTHSLQLRGTGTTYTDFTWHVPFTSSHDLVNAGQTLGALVYATSLSLSPPSVDESGGASAATATLTLSPAPAASRTFTLSSSDNTEATVPASVVVTVSGTVTFPVSAVLDGMVDGNQSVTITATDSGALYPAQTALLTVRDVDVPLATFSGLLRVACLNVKDGVGAPGSMEYLAVREQVQRINPQVIAFEEVNAAGDFADMKSLLSELGFPIVNSYFATKGDGFATFEGGATSTSNAQSLCLASKFPITQTVQIDRGETSRSEMTRYPLFVSVDVPGIPAADDPAFVVVHLKANSGGTGAMQGDRFRRAVEAYRITQFLQNNGWNGATKNCFVLGDFNENDFDNSQPVSIDTTAPFTDGSTLPASFVLGPDLAGGVTLPYATFPHAIMDSLNLAAPETRQADGSTRGTFNLAENSRIDYIFARKPMTLAGLYASEVYNSRLEAGFDGLPKSGTGLPSGKLSFTASDHFAVFADVPLAIQPKLTLTTATSWVNEADLGLVNVTLTLSQAPGVGVNVPVTLSAYRPGRISIPQSIVMFTGSQTSAVIPVEILHPSDVDAHRAITVSATAPGWFPGKTTFEIRNQEAGGALIISQYLEPVSSSNARAIELLNQSGAEIDFSATPLTVRRFTNGDVEGINEASVLSGMLPAGQVLVIGDGASGEALLAGGLIIAQAGSTPAVAPNGTLFYDAAGKLKFLKDTFTYNGNDALEILLNFTRMDVFGTIGQDPGTAWTGGGVSTANQNLSLKPFAGTGSQGFTDPSTRFQTVSTTDATTGLGVAPVLTDPYLAWATPLTGLDKAPEADPDHDGLRNLMEYALNTNALMMTAQPLQIVRTVNGEVLSAVVRIPAAGECLTYALEQSSDLAAWSASSVVPSFTSVGGGMQVVSFAISLNGARQSFRLLVKRG